LPPREAGALVGLRVGCLPGVFESTAPVARRRDRNICFCKGPRRKRACTAREVSPCPLPTRSQAPADRPALASTGTGTPPSRIASV
jgi:hypothetical protein